MEDLGAEKFACVHPEPEKELVTSLFFTFGDVCLLFSVSKGKLSLLPVFQTFSPYMIDAKGLEDSTLFSMLYGLTFHVIHHHLSTH